ncbi:hypothetical protein AMTRI_Chr11g98260 [Amborella trichopoda]
MVPFCSNPPAKSLNFIVPMLGLGLVVIFLSGLFELPAANVNLIGNSNQVGSNSGDFLIADHFTDMLGAFKKWDSRVGCAQFTQKYKDWSWHNSSMQDPHAMKCGDLKMGHVSILVKGWTWIPDNLDGMYSCRCGLTCLWTKSPVLADKPDAFLFETTTPPSRRREGDPLRVYMDLEAGRKSSGYEDIFISYHAKDDVQSTYAGALFHNNRNYYVSPQKNNDTLVYWSSSRCLPKRNQLARELLTLLPHHSFGNCLNNVGGPDMALAFYPECGSRTGHAPKWWDHLHCAMSHYKFVLAIENTETESYVTEKLFYALDSGAVPIYFGAPNVADFVPPHSIINGKKFESLGALAKYVKALSSNPVAYAEYHAWRRCGVMGGYRSTREVSLDTLPCRLCEAVSSREGRRART